MVMMMDVLADHQMKFSLFCWTHQNSFIMLSLDLPTPTHFTEKGIFSSYDHFDISKHVSRLCYVIAYGSDLHSMYIFTWHLQEILDKANVSLCLWRQLIKTADSLSATTPARERLISHLNLCEDVHVC